MASRKTDFLCTLDAYHLTEKSGWDVESIMVSDYHFTAELSHPLWFESKKRGVSLEPTRNREIGKW